MVERNRWLPNIVNSKCWVSENCKCMPCLQYQWRWALKIRHAGPFFAVLCLSFLCSSLYFFIYFLLALGCFWLPAGLQEVTAVEEVNKKLFEMQGPVFYKDSGAEFFAIWCLQAGTDFPINSASSLPGVVSHSAKKTSKRKMLNCLRNFAPCESPVR